MRGGLVVAFVGVLSALCACTQAHHATDVDAGGTGGSGATGGAAGNGGSSGEGGSGNVGAGDGGSSGVGGGGSGGDGGVGTGGVGGVAGDCATRPPIDECPGLADGWFAVKTTLDVWWPGAYVIDPGRSEIDVTTLARVSAVCDSAGDLHSTAVIKVCDLTLPTFTSDVFCEAFELSIPHETWEHDSMPRFTTTLEFGDLSPGNLFHVTPWVGLLGIDLANGNEAGTWPSATFDGALLCEEGSGAACFVDHDGDNRGGITAQVRSDDATHVGPYDNGLCANGSPYRYRAMPTTLDIGAGGGQTVPRALTLGLGVRTHVGASGEIAPSCSDGMGATAATSFDVRAADCVVDLTTLYWNDPRTTTLEDTCTEDEATFIDRTLPAYQVLQADSTPSDSGRLVGWQMINRDIDKSPSAGPRSSWVYMGPPSDAEPTCRIVRSAMLEYHLR